MRARELLSEAQIYNLDGSMFGVAAHFTIAPEPLQKWFKPKFSRFLSTVYSGPALVRATPEEFETMKRQHRGYNDLAWLTKAYEAGELYNLRLVKDQSLITDASNIVDYYKHLCIEDPPRALKFLKANWQQAATAARRWHQSLLKNQGKSIDKTIEGQETVLPLGEYTWVKLTTEAALKAEGECMGHCVGRAGYINDVQAGKAEIYSLRDKNNEAHATLEVQITDGQKLIQQCKGRGNEVIVGKYVPHVNAAVEKLNLYWGLNGLRDMAGLVNYLRRPIGKPEQITKGAVSLRAKYVPVTEVMEKVRDFRSEYAGKATLFLAKDYGSNNHFFKGVANGFECIIKMIIGDGYASVSRSDYTPETAEGFLFMCEAVEQAVGERAKKIFEGMKNESRVWGLTWYNDRWTKIDDLIQMVMKYVTTNLRADPKEVLHIAFTTLFGLTHDVNKVFELISSHMDDASRELGELFANVQFTNSVFEDRRLYLGSLDGLHHFYNMDGNKVITATTDEIEQKLAAKKSKGRWTDADEELFRSLNEG